MKNTFTHLASLLLPFIALAEVSISPTFREFSQTGGGAAILTSGTGSWTASTAQSWINITPTTSGSAGTNVFYMVDANPSADPRNGVITIGNASHEVRQTGYNATISPTSLNASADGESISVSVVPEAIVSWTATSQSSWITVDSGASGFGNGSVGISVAPYDGVVSRSGSVIIAGQTFTVTQGGIDVALEPESTKLPTNATKILFVQVRALAGTAWDPQSQVSWISVIDPGAKFGDSTVTLAISQNTSYLERVGTVKIGTATFTVTQAGVASPTINVSPTQTTAAPSGASGTIRVAGTFDTPVRVESLSAWLTIAGGLDHVVPKDVNFGVAANSLSESRTGQIRVSSPATSVPVDLIRGLIGHWPSINDLSSWGRNLVGSNDQLSYDGTSTVTIGGRGNLHRKDDSLTLSLIFTSGTSGSKRPLVSWHRNNEGCSLYINENDRVALWRGPLPGTSSTVVAEELVSDYVVSPQTGYDSGKIDALGGYHHVVLTVDTARNATLRLRPIIADGSEAPLPTTTSRQFTVKPYPQDLNTSDFRIAYTKGPVEVRLTGQLRDIRLWERVLSLDEIVTLEKRWYGPNTQWATSANTKENAWLVRGYNYGDYDYLDTGNALSINNFSYRPPDGERLWTSEDLVIEKWVTGSSTGGFKHKGGIGITATDDVMILATSTFIVPKTENYKFGWRALESYRDGYGWRAPGYYPWDAGNDRIGMWVDLNKNGIFESNESVGTGTNDKTLGPVSLTQGDEHLVAIAFYNHDDILRILPRIHTQTWNDWKWINPAGSAQNGYWKVKEGDGWRKPLYSDALINHEFHGNGLGLSINKTTFSMPTYPEDLAPFVTDRFGQALSALQVSPSITTSLYFARSYHDSASATYGIWFKIDGGFGSGTVYNVLQRGNFVVRIEPSNNPSSTLHLRVDTGSKQATVPLSLEQGKWHHLLLACATNHMTTVFLDGEEVGSTPLLTGYEFGKEETGPHLVLGGWDGVLDDFRVFDHVFTAIQARENFEAEKPKQAIVTVTQGPYAGSLSPNSLSFSADGGTGQTTLSLPGGTAWNFSSSEDWVTLSGGNSGSGGGSHTLQVGANPTVYPREAKVSFGTAELTVFQSGRVVTLDKRSGSFGNDGGSLTLQVSAEAGGTWTAESDVDWIAIAQGAQGQGSGAVFYIVSPFVGGAPSRTAKITVAGIEHLVTQSGYTVSISPNAQNISGDGGKGIVEVSASIEAVWQALALEPWITILGGQDGIGNGRIEYVLTPNETGAPRSGVIVIGGQTHTISQSPAVANDSEAIIKLDEAVAEKAALQLVYEETLTQLQEVNATVSSKVEEGRNLVIASPNTYGLVTEEDANESIAQARESAKQEVVQQPATYNLVSKAVYDQAQVDLASAQTLANQNLETGRSQVIASPNTYGLVTEEDANESIAQARESAKQEVVQQPETYNLVTKAVYDQAQADLTLAQTKAEQNLFDGRSQVISSPEVYGLLTKSNHDQIVEDLISASDTNSTPYTPSWFYVPEHGWLWTEKRVYPWFYDAKSNNWLYFKNGKEKPQFYHYGTKQWISME